MNRMEQQTAGADDQRALEDIKLVEGALRNHRAFDAIVERYYAMVFAVGFSYLQDPDAAQDLAQEVFARAYLHLKSLKEPRTLPAWLCRITRNQALDWTRKRQARSRLVPMIAMDDLPSEQVAPHQLTPRETAAAREEWSQVMRAVSTLPAPQREMLWLHYFEDLSKREIARRLALHPASVCRQLDRALGHLRRALGLMEAVPRGAVPVAMVTRALTLVALLGTRPSATRAMLEKATADTALLGLAGLSGGLGGAVSAKAAIVTKALGAAGAILACALTAGVIWLADHRPSGASSASATGSGLALPAGDVRIRHLSGVQPPPASRGRFTRSGGGERRLRKTPPTDELPLVTSDETSVTVFGTVYMEKGGARVPAAGAQVSLSRLGAPSVTAAADGSYRLSGITQREGELVATLGELRAPADRAERRILRFTDGRDNGPYDLILEPLATLAGAVVSKETGAPVAGAKVTAFAELHRQNPLEFYPSERDIVATTDENGFFWMEGLPRGRQKLRVTARGYGDLIEHVDLAGDEENRVVLELDRGGVIHVTGVYSDGKPLDLAALNVRRNGGWIIPCHTDANGYVTLENVGWDVPHTLWLWKHNQSSSQAQVTLKRGEAETSVTLRFDRTRKEAMAHGMILGKVTAESGQPVSGVTIGYQQTWAVSRNIAPDTVRSGPDGTFRLNALGPQGVYHISVFGPGWSPAWADASFGQDGKPTRLSIVLKRGHYVEGMVTDPEGRPLPGVAVRAYPLDAGPFSTSGHPGMPETTTDEDGRFRLDNMPGPAVRLRLTRNGWLLRETPVVDVDQEVRLQMIPSRGFMGQVLDSGNVPVKEFLVKVSGPGVEEELRDKGRLFSDENGRFHLENLQPGRSYKLTVSTPSGRLMSARKRVLISRETDKPLPEEIIVLHGQAPDSDGSR